MQFLEAPRRQESFVKRMIDCLPGRTKEKKGQETKDTLVDAFVLKAFSDIENSGFTVLRRICGSNGYTSEISNSTIMYKNGEQGYKAQLTAVKDKIGVPYPQVSRLKLELQVDDNVDLSSLPLGESRHGFIHKEVYPQIKDSKEDTDEIRYQESGSAYFYKIIKQETKLPTGQTISIGSGPDLSLEDTNAFLRELLICSIDVEATRKEYDETVINRKRNDLLFNEESSTHWNREKPGELSRFFSR